MIFLVVWIICLSRSLLVTSAMANTSMPRRTAWVTLIVPKYKTTIRVIRALMRLIIAARMMK
jgi:hypothetical protein